jgi:hypothetical protein
MGEMPQLPADHIVQTDELAALLKSLEAEWSGPGQERPVVSVIGKAGMGKTAFAIRAAQRLADVGRFPDGQLFVDLQGTRAGLPPLEPLEVLACILRLLGVGPTAVPAGVDEAAAKGLQGD